MSEPLIRPANRDDARFLAWIMQEADRGHIGIGTWDLLFPGEEGPRLDILEHLVRSGSGTYVDWSLFLVAEVGGQLAAAVGGYAPAETSDDRFEDLLISVMAARGWSSEQAREALKRSRSRAYFLVPVPDDTLRVEWVATRSEHRGRGLIRRLLAELLEDAAAAGRKTSHVATYVGNAPAIRAYERAGFAQYAEVRHADYERVLGAPGSVYLRKDL